MLLLEQMCATLGFKFPAKVQSNTPNPATERSCVQFVSLQNIYAAKYMIREWDQRWGDTFESTRAKTTTPC